MVVQGQQSMPHRPKGLAHSSHDPYCMEHLGVAETARDRASEPRHTPHVPPLRIPALLETCHSAREPYKHSMQELKTLV